MRAMISMKLNPEMWETDWVSMVVVVVTQLHGTTSALSDGLAICIRACPLEPEKLVKIIFKLKTEVQIKECTVRYGNGLSVTALTQLVLD